MERYEALAQAFLQAPFYVEGIYRTYLEPNGVYRGHIDKPTTRCGVVIGLKGEATFTFNGSRSIPLSAGASLIGGYNMHLEIEVGSEGFEYCLLHYMPENLDMQEAQLLADVTQLGKTCDPLLHQLMEQLLHAAQRPGAIGQLEKKSLFYRIVSLLLQAERQQQNGQLYPVMEEMLQFIQAHYMEPLTLKQLADRCQLKPKYFSALFQKFAGIAPIDYVIQYRMDQAQAMLMTGQYTVAAVARSVGYHDPYYFSRLYKKHKGTPPSQVMQSAK